MLNEGLHYEPFSHQAPKRDFQHQDAKKSILLQKKEILPIPRTAWLSWDFLRDYFMDHTPITFLSVSVKYAK